jgi:DNA-binding winged helix-turn-helix (wHTH) protein
MNKLNRSKQQARINEQIAEGECCAVVGLSNTGKSALLRTICAPQGRPSSRTTEGPLLFYVDCNRMLDLSEQGFYEAILRAIRSRLRESGAASDLAARLEEDYSQVIEPRSPLAVALGFSDALERICETGRRVVLVLDEFDEPFQALEGRTFLNLRALRDRYRERLVYVTATARTLDEIRDDSDTAEFRELFAGQVCRLGALDQDEAAAVVAAQAAEEGVTLTTEETDFVVRGAGGHPGLLRAVTRLLVHARTVAPQTYERMGISLVEEALAGDQVTRGECDRLWAELTAAERKGLLALSREESLSEQEMEQLQRLGLVSSDGDVFGAAFAAFVRERGGRRADVPPGVWVDEEAGEVYVDGHRAPTLTDLEYRLLRALYGRKDKLCDKYRLVEEVWGESYIDEVDDARIEKLVSRVRAKVEEEPANPRYLVTVRGRGYRLLSRPQESGS